MRVLILGASGFLGRHVLALLKARPELQVMVGPRSHDLDLGRAGPVEWHRLLQDADPDVVVNCAGRTHGTPEELTRANLELVRNLIGAAQEQRPPPRIVHLGSAAEYGPGASTVSPGTPAHPASPYGETKLAGTQALLGARPSVQVTVLRVFNPVGTGQSAQTLTGTAAVQFWQARHDPASRTEVQFGDLSAARDFIDARDVARAVETVLLHPDTGDIGPVLNVGRGEAVVARTLIRTLADLAHYDGPVSERQGGSARSAGLPWQKADISELSRLGWAPAYSLEHALESLWQEVDADPSYHRSSA